MIKIPAIDLRSGRVVRLRQGDYLAETLYPEEPEQLARCYAEAGASHLHVVDLDAARAGIATQLDLIGRIAGIKQLQVQAGGGIRTHENIRTLLALGVERVVIGSVAVKSPEQVKIWAKQFSPDQIVIALDTKQDVNGYWRLPVAGWTQETDALLYDRMTEYVDAGLYDFLITDIHRDGMLSGVNTALYDDLGKHFPTARLQASGGIASLDDLRALEQIGCAGVVIGRALLEARFDLSQALSC